MRKAIRRHKNATGFRRGQDNCDWAWKSCRDKALVEMDLGRTEPAYPAPSVLGALRPVWKVLS